MFQRMARWHSRFPRARWPRSERMCADGEREISERRRPAPSARPTRPTSGSFYVKTHRHPFFMTSPGLLHRPCLVLHKSTSSVRARSAACVLLHPFTPAQGGGRPPRPRARPPRGASRNSSHRPKWRSTRERAPWPCARPGSRGAPARAAPPSRACRGGLRGLLQAARLGVAKG